MARIEQHPILEFKKGREVTFTYEGQELKGYEGETIAAALHAAGVRSVHESEKKHRHRGLFCAIGNCSSCLMKVNGIPNVRVCVEPLREGIAVERQVGNVKPEVDVHIEAKLSNERELVKTELLVIGGGPAGMCAAIEAAEAGVQVLMLERNSDLGGQLIKQTHKFFGSEKQNAGTRGVQISIDLAEKIQTMPQITLWTDSIAAGFYKNGVVMVDKNGVVEGVKAERIIVATGAFEKNLVFPNNDLPGVYGAGAVQTLMNMEGIIPAKNVLMVGGGNIGLIVSYQLMQAGVNVAAVIEAAPKIGGYQVHANKLRRAQVPVMTQHTIKYAYGKEKVEGAVICQVDDHFQPIPGTEQDVKCDAICMAVGLQPLPELFFQAGCEMKFVPELGGYVPVIDDARHTSVPNVYAAGDSGGVEEASSAMLTGKLAGLSAANDFGRVPDFDAKFKDYLEQLDSLRPEGGKIKNGIVKTKEGSPVNYEH